MRAQENDRNDPILDHENTIIEGICFEQSSFSRKVKKPRL